MANFVFKKQVDWFVLGWLLVGDLREALEEELTPENASWIEPIVDTLVVCLGHPDSDPRLEPAAQSIMDNFPGWASAFDDLQAQRQVLVAALEELSIRIDWGLPSAELADDVRGMLSEWVHKMVSLQSQELDLVQAAYYWDSSALPFASGLSDA